MTTVTDTSDSAILAAFHLGMLAQQRLAAEYAAIPARAARIAAIAIAEMQAAR